MATQRLILFGTVRLEHDTRPVHLGRTKALALLAYLAVARQPQRRELLLALLWPDYDAASARNNLRRDLSVLRATIGHDALIADRAQIALRPTAALWLDVAAFGELIALSRRHEHAAGALCAACGEALSRAVHLYTGDFMAGFGLADSLAYDDWLLFQRERLRDELAAALQSLVAWHSANSRYDLALEYARRWLALDPLHEPAVRALIRVYAWSGHRAAALRQYIVTARLLQTELDAEPEAETTLLYEAIKARRVPSPPTDAGTSSPRRLPAHGLRHNLPSQPTALVGRAQELRLLRSYLDSPDVRLITIVGPGGVGKTRLALAAAEGAGSTRTQLDDIHAGAFPDGRFLVALAAVAAVEHLVPAVAQALGIGASADREDRRPLRQQLLDYLRDKRLLLVLDNFEQLLDGTELISAVLYAAPGVTAIVTSRERLRLRNEHLLTLAGLAFPASADEPGASETAAVQLFVQAARRVRHDFVLTATDISSLVALCHLVEGMPLALELAAAWIDLVPLSEILAQVQRSFDFLATELRDVPLRQRSIRAVFDSSWQRLAPDKQHVFAALAVLRGAFTRAAAQAVADVSLSTLAELVAASLVAYDRSTDRYAVHELLRQYGGEQLARWPEAEQRFRDRHAAYFCTVLGQWYTALHGTGQGAALTAIERSFEDVLAAWQHAVARGQWDALAQAADGLGQFCTWRMRIAAGYAAFHAATQRLGDDPPTGLLRLAARLRVWEASFCRLGGRREAAEGLVRHSLALLDRPELANHETRAERAFARFEQGRLAYASGRAEARHVLEQSLRDYQALGQEWHASNVLAALSQVLKDAGDLIEARRAAERSLAIRQTCGDVRGAAHMLERLSQTAAEAGRIDEAELLVRRSNRLYEELGDEDGRAAGLSQLGVILMWLGQYDEAQAVLKQSLALARKLGNPTDVARTGGYLGLALASGGQYADAPGLIDDSLRSARANGAPREAAWSLWALGYTWLGLGREADAEAALRESVALDRAGGHTGQLGWSLALLGYLAWRRGDADEAVAAWLEVLRTATDGRDFLGLLMTLPAIALFIAERGHTERAIELWALAWRHPVLSSAAVANAIFADRLQSLTAAFPPDVRRSAWTRGTELDLKQQVAVLPKELLALLKCPILPAGGSEASIPPARP